MNVPWRHVVGNKSAFLLSSIVIYEQFMTAVTEYLPKCPNYFN